MKGKPFQPIPDPDGSLSPPPRKPPTAIATDAPVPEGRGGGKRARRERRALREAEDRVLGERPAALARLADALEAAAGRIARVVRGGSRA